MNMKTLFKAFSLFVVALLCMASCSTEETNYTSYRCYRQAEIPAPSTGVKNGKSYRMVHFVVLEIGNSKFYRYEVYNDDAVAYYGMKGTSSLAGYPGWNYDPNAVKTIGYKMEKGRFVLEDGTVLNWVTSDDNNVTALKDKKGVVLYVGWDSNEDL